MLLGSIAPDIPLYFLSLGGLAWFHWWLGWDLGDTMRHMYSNLFYNDTGWISLHNVLHSPLVCILSLLWLRLRLSTSQFRTSWYVWFFSSCFLHTLVDIPVHHDDGPLIFWPLNWTYRFASPLSYWDPQHYGREVMAFEGVLATLLLSNVLIARFRNRTRQKDHAFQGGANATQKLIRFLNSPNKCLTPEQQLYASVSICKFRSIQFDLTSLGQQMMLRATIFTIGGIILGVCLSIVLGFVLGSGIYGDDMFFEFAIYAIGGALTGATLGFGIHYFTREPDISRLYAEANRERKPSEILSGETVAQQQEPFFSGKKYGTVGIVRGSLLCVAAVVWFVLGLTIDRIYFYPPVLFILGLVDIFRAMFWSSPEE